MQKLYWLFCGIIFTFLQNYIWQLLAIGHDYPVPVDKHNSDENFTPPPPPLTPSVGSKGKYLNFAITQ